MLKTAMEHHGLTRRSFLKTTAFTAVGAAALGTLAGCSTGGKEGEEPKTDQPTEVAEETYFQSCMGNCSAWGCPFYVHVRDGKVCNITKPGLKCPDGTPNPFQDVCLKGYANIERMYSETRVKYPMRRVNEKGVPGEFERISWDEAIDEICSKWTELREEYGPDSVAFFSGSGSGMASISYTNRLKTLMEAMTISPCYDTTGMNCQWNHCGYNPLVNGHNEYRDILNAKNIFIWGSNPTESNIVEYHFATQARENGAKVIVIDPIYTTSASKADMYVPIRPATDGLLAIGMAQIAIRDGFVDKAHLQTLTVAPFLVKDSDGLYLRLSDLGKAEAGSEGDRILVYEGGQAVAFDAAKDPEIEGSFEVEGVAVKTAYQILLERIAEWDLETIASYTDVPVATIEELASIYTSGPSMIFTGYGMDHYSNGQTGYDGMFALADITGQECKHGAGISCTDFSGPVPQGIVGTATADLQDIKPGSTIYAAHFHELVEKGSLGPVASAPKSVYIYIVNPIGNLPERLKWVDSLSKMELVVVSDMFMSETATYADIVLPVAFLFERDDMPLSLPMNPYVKITEKAVDPLFEAKSDFDIITMLGKGMGFDEYFTQTLEEFLKSCVGNDTASAAGITWDRLKEEKAIWSYPEEPVVVGLTTPPFTPTGRMEFYHEGIKPQFDYGQEWDMKKESCWFWEPPLEAWHENELFSKYPLIFISERSKFKTHTMFNNAPMLHELDPEPYIKINQVDAEARGIKEGDLVRLYNDRGDVTLKAVINSGCRPGMLVIDHGWEEVSFVDGHYSNLSSSASWPRFEQSNWFDCLCEMEKVQ